jgi:hypothetical protein
MPRVGLEHTIPVIEQAKTFRALHSAANVNLAHNTTNESEFLYKITTENRSISIKAG